MFKIFLSTLYYELLLFGRERHVILHSLGFFIIVTVLFPIALTPYPELLQKSAPAILWVAATVACLLALENWLKSDVADQAIEQLLLSVHPLPWLVFAKLIAFWLVVILPLLLITPLLGLLLQLSSVDIVILSLSLLTGTPAIIAIGATCKALTLSLQEQGVLLGLLVLPLTLPILIMGVNTLLQSRVALSVTSNLAFLSGVSLLCLCFLPLAIGSALRWGENR